MIKKIESKPSKNNFNLDFWEKPKKNFWSIELLSDVEPSKFDSFLQIMKFLKDIL